MLIEATITVASLLDAAKLVSAGTAVIGLIAGVFKVITWIKSKLTSIENNVVDLKKSVDTNIGGLREDIKTQTTAITTALSEQRQDFRTFYAPTLLLMQQQSANFQANTTLAPARAKQPIRRKAPKKKV